MHLIASLLCVLLFSNTAQANDPQRIEGWQTDLSMLAEELPKRHINPFTQTTREKFDASISELRGKLDSLNDDQIVVAMMQIAASLGDAHTCIYPTGDAHAFHTYPIAFYIFSDGPFVAVADTQHREILGSKLVGIGSVDFDEATKRVDSVFAWENESHRKHTLPRFMNNAEVLHAVGLSDSAEHATFVVQMPDGSKKNIELTPIAAGTKPNLARLPDWSKIKDRPVSLTPHQGVKYWFECLEPKNTIYCRYDACVNDPKKPFKTFADELLGTVDSKNIRKVIIDVRNNSGGDSGIAEVLINGLRNRQKKNPDLKLYVLIGRTTFSSAQMNALQFRQRTKATLVGEPTGQKPNAFGEIKTFTLPNSKLTVQYSTKYFRMQEKDEPSTMPDVTIDPTSADFFAGRDVVLQKVLDE